MSEINNIVHEVKEHILNEYLPDEDPELLSSETPLITSGVLDSLSVLKLHIYLETRYQIVIPPDSAEKSLNTLSDISQLIQSQLAH